MTVCRWGLLAALLLGWGLPKTSADRPIRMGWIDRFASGAFSEDQIAAFAPHLVGYDPLSCPEQSIVLQPVPATDITVNRGTLAGVCGAEVQIPESFKVSPHSSLYRGLICDARRPGRESRQRWIHQTRQWNEQDHSPLVAMPVLGPDMVPSDVLVCIDRNDDWQIGCDWNADLHFEPTECFRLSASQHDLPVMASSGDATVVIRRASVAPDQTPQLQMLCIAAAQSGWRSVDPGQAVIADFAAKLSRQDGQQQVQWVLLPTGRGAADLAAAMAAAEHAGCDAVLVNLDQLLHWPTDATRLLAELSRQTQIPVVVTRQTPISPKFHVEPARLSIPDIAEIHFSPSKSDSAAFSHAVDELITDLARFRVATQATRLVGTPTQANSYIEPIAGDLPHDRFMATLDDDRCVVRVPGNAIDGRVVISDRQANFDDIDATLYDKRGMRVTGIEHTNGIRFDSMPPAQAFRARGGYLVAKQRLFYRGRTVATLSDDVRLQWTRPSDGATTDTDGSSTSIKPSYEIDRLQRVGTHDVPPYVRQIATGLTERGPSVASWWYREPPRHGSIAYHHVFQDPFSKLHWANNRLQFWVVYEDGRLLPGYRTIGDLGGSNPRDAWILVQGAITDDITTANPPELIQSEAVSNQVPADMNWHPFHPAMMHSNDTSQNTSSLDTKRIVLPRDDRFLFAEVRPRNGEAPGYGWRWAVAPQHRSEPLPWLKLYDHDAVQAAINEQKSTGVTATEIVTNTPRPAENSEDIVAWRAYLLAIDQAEVRKLQIDETVHAARRVLALCRGRLGGLPSPETPSHDDFLDSRGQPIPPDPSASDAIPVFRVRYDRQWQQTYAWAVDAAYRLTRAIGYRELPEVIAEHPIANQTAQDADYEAAFFQLCGLVEIRNPRFALTLVRYHHRRNEPVKAYEILTRYAYEGPSTPWYFKKERDLWEQSGVASLSRLGHARWFLHEAGQPIRQVSP